MKELLAVGCVYLAAGVATAALTAHLWEEGRPRFEGLPGAGPVGTLLETVLLWPLALAVNVKGMRT